MSPPRSHGSHPGPGVGAETRAALSKSLGDSNLQDRGLGLGKPKDGGLVGKSNSVWAKAAVKSGSSLTDFEVQHTLGAVPVLCRLERVESPLDPDVQVVATPIKMNLWTKTTCRVALNELVGSLSGATLTFYVGGE